MWAPIPGLSIEEGESAELEKCSDCNKHAISVWGYVSKNGKAHAAYYAAWTPGHLDRGLKMLVSIGNFSTPQAKAQRKMLGLECRMGEKRPSFMIFDASRIELDEEGTFGKGLSREEAMNDPIKNDAFLAADHACFCDKRIKSFLQNE